MTVQLHDYQQAGKSHILENRATGLFFRPGRGKTLTTLEAVHDLMYDSFTVSKTLVIAPLRVAQDTWVREIEKWPHLESLTTVAVLGSESQRIAALNSQASIYVTNRENVPWLVEYQQKAKRWPFDMVVIDELSSFKSAGSERFKALRKVLCKNRAGKGGDLVNRVVGLTGTPTSNGYEDLWSQVFLLDSGQRLGGSMSAYREKYFVPDKMNRGTGQVYSWKLKPGAKEEIDAAIADICLSVDTDLNLGRIDNVIHTPLTAKEMAAYRKLERDLLLQMPDGDIEAPTAAVLANKLLQLTSGSVYDEHGKAQCLHDAKIEALDRVVRETGSPVLVFYGYEHEKNRLLEAFSGAGVLRTPDDIKKWNQGGFRVLLAHPASAGHGLNLQEGGSTIVWTTLPWSLELYEQANARLHRQGQRETVTIHHLVVPDSIDERVLAALADKRVTQQNLIDALDWRKRALA